MTLSPRLAVTRPLHVFAVTWFGLLVSLTGTGVASFALGAKLFADSGSVTQFSLLGFSYAFPMVLLAPFAGVLTDRWDRRQVMLLSYLGSGFSLLLLWLVVVASDRGLWAFQAWHLYLMVALGSAFRTFGPSAYFATIPLLVPKKHLGRANGLLELANATQLIIAPVLGAALLTRIGLSNIILINLGALLFTVGTLLLVRFPRPPSTERGGAARGSWWKEFAFGWTYMRERPGLMGLLLFMFSICVVQHSVSTLLSPLVLTFADIHALGRVQAVAGGGLLLGGLVMGIWGGPQRRMKGLMISQLFAGAVLFLAVLPASTTAISLTAVLFLFSVPLGAGAAQAIWQSKVALDVQGRVSAVRRMFLMSAGPLVALVIGPLTDGCFEPWMAEGGALAGTLGRVLGTGPGRGMALMYLLLGVMMIASVLVALVSPRLRNLEEEVPDALPAQSTPALEAHAMPVASGSGLPRRAQGG